MEGHEHNLVTFIENSFRAISLVDIPIEYKHFLALSSRQLGLKSHVVEVAETVMPCSMRMMPWRPDDAKASIFWTFIVKYLAYSGQGCVSREFCCHKCLIAVVKRLPPDILALTVF